MNIYHCISVVIFHNFLDIFAEILIIMIINMIKVNMILYIYDSVLQYNGICINMIFVKVCLHPFKINLSVFNILSITFLIDLKKSIHFNATFDSGKTFQLNTNRLVEVIVLF